MINSELLKEAIADAKAVRATALANAKASLEEAFAPRFEAMFAEKLKEESEEEQEQDLQEVEAPNQVSGKGGEAKGPATKAVSKGNPKTPKGGAGDKDFKAVQAGLGPKGVPKLGKKVNETAEEDEKDEVDENSMQSQEQGQDAGLTSADLDEIIKELEGEVAGEENGEESFGNSAPSPEGEENPFAGMGNGEEGAPETGEVDGSEVNAEPGSEVNIDLGAGAGGEEGEEGEEQLPQGMNAGGIEGEEDGEQGQGQEVPQGGEFGGEFGGSEKGGFPAPAPKPEEDEDINLEELLAALNEEADEEDEEKMDEMTNHGVPTNVGGQDKKGGVKGYPSAPQDASKKQLKGKNHNISGQGNIGTGAVGGKPMQESTQYRVALREAYDTIEFLRGQINEVNLLNAKLLYTNKLFKEFAGVLDDSYRMKIVESFDLTKSVREVKLAYALLAESLNFGTQITRSQRIVQSGAKPTANTTKGQIKQITEGFASKPVSSTKPSKIITEGNEMALRFKKLAGIKEAPKVISDRK